MSQQWPGGLIRPTPVTPTGPYQDGTAPGVWTLDQMNYWLKQGLWPIAGNVMPGQQSYTTPGTYTWVCPAGVTSVSVVCVGGGGAGGSDTGSGTSGGLSSFTSGSIVVTANGGAG
ncbi:MAG: hypothetical protein EBX40_06565, partial [Gammaproteobacteria bacterium]|nr:hypothetical protein [Gammaproteobacteria bacterium]